MTEPSGKSDGQAKEHASQAKTEADPRPVASPLRQAFLRALYGAVWRLARPFLARHKRLHEGFAWRLVPQGWSALPTTGGKKPKEQDIHPQGDEQVDLWIQAASGGEAYLTWEVLRQLAPQNQADRQNGKAENIRPLRVLATTWTRQGLEVLHGMAETLRRDQPGLNIRVTLFPLDEPRLMAKALDSARPRAIALLETELWPGLLLAAAERSIPVLILNGRMTEKSLRNYGKLERLCPGFWQSVAPKAVLGISEADTRRFATLFGAQNCTVAPNIKFDRCLPAESSAPRPDIGSLLPAPQAGARLLLASVREEEEDALLTTIRLLRKTPGSSPAPTIIIAPRHMQRVKAWQERLRASEFLGPGGLWLRSQLTAENSAPAGSTLIWDAFGELTALYAAADAVFVGGSLAALGGQNFLEALALGKSPCCGPYLDNFAWALSENGQGEANKGLRQLGLLRICQNARELATDLLEQANKPKNAGQTPEEIRTHFQAWLAPRLGGTARCVDAIRACLDE